MIPMTGIAAMARNRTIGNAGKIPWHYSADFKWFREYTLNKCILVGRSTYENLPKLLNRKILVLSNSQSFSYYDWQYDSSVSTITLENLENIKLPVIVAGGAQIYSLLMPYIVEFYVTELNIDVDGDTKMPEFESQFPNKEIFKQLSFGNIIKYSKNN